MATDAPPPPAPARGRPSPLLLVGLGVVVGLYLMIQFWPAAKPPPAPAPRVQATTGQGGTDAAVKPEDLQVRLGELNAQRPGPSDTERNPFVFKPKPLPPPPPSPPPPKFTPPPPAMTNPGPPPPPPPPPIALKFMGTVEGPFGKMGAFSDCKRTFMAKDGDIVDGRYKVIKIGLESATLQYVDGRGGPQMIRMSGQDCINK